MKAVLSAALLCASLGAQASCPVSRPAEPPLDAIPDGATASWEEMHAAQELTRHYVERGERYLRCDYVNRRQYNRLLSSIELLAETYNTELVEFQARQPVVADSQ